MRIHPPSSKPAVHFFHLSIFCKCSIPPLGGATYLSDRSTTRVVLGTADKTAGKLSLCKGTASYGRLKKIVDGSTALAGERCYHVEIHLVCKHFQIKLFSVNATDSAELLD